MTLKEHGARFQEFYVIQIWLHQKWTRVGKAYLSKDVAKSWVPFVKSAWHGARARTKTVRVPFDEAGRPTAAAVDMVLEEFNIDLA